MTDRSPSERQSREAFKETQVNQANQSSPGTAAVLSLIVPGVGQIYNGDFLRGVFWLIVTPGFWIGTAGLFGWPFHLISAYTAHLRGTKRLRGEIV